MRETHAATTFIARLAAATLGTLTLAALTLAALTLAALTLGGCNAGTDQSPPIERDQAIEREQAPDVLGEPERAPSVNTSKSADTSRVGILDNLADVVDRALPSVVGISTQMKVDARRTPHGSFDRSPSPFPAPPGFEGRDPGTRRAMGSGVVISTDGYVLTNNHVVEGADQIRVRIDQGREYDAEVVGTDPKSDLAVLHIQDAPDELDPLPFAQMKQVNLGDPVVAIGSPFGLVSTVTFGIISATGRHDVGITDYEDFIQTDAAINPGNSGGPLVNMNGEIAGINTAILSRTGGYQGIGFAIPASMAKNIAESLIKYGRVTRGWLGVGIQTLTPELASALDLSPDIKGVLVSDVQPDSPAANAGLQRGDVVVSIADNPVGGASELRNRVALRQPGESVELDVLRDGDTQTLSVQLGEMPGEADQPAIGGGQDQLQGLTLAPLNPDLSQQFNIPADIDSGAVVAGLEPGSSAARMGLRPGDVILEVNHQRVESGDEFSRAYRTSQDRILFLIVRDGSTLFLAASKPG
jgi:serine protease Do